LVLVGPDFAFLGAALAFFFQKTFKIAFFPPNEREPLASVAWNVNVALFAPIWQAIFRFRRLGSHAASLTPAKRSSLAQPLLQKP
jgi:hypothetical protein